MTHYRPIAACLVLLLAGCGAPPDDKGMTATPGTADATTTAAAPAVTDRTLGFSLPVPAGMTLRRDFQRSYLDNGNWAAFAGPDDHGDPVAALVMAGSNHVTAAELRIGSSSDAAAMAHCDDVPAEANVQGEVTRASLAGVAFRHFRAADAAMSHYRQVESYRTVRHGRCMAIDLLVVGTRPEVYDPPATVPFTGQQAWSALHAALAGLHWTR